MLTLQQAAIIPPGYEYRLPTEAEWEYACRAGSTTEFNVGADLFCNQANISFSYHSNSNCNATAPMPVASYAPNAWGLYDMHGNVREWCLDSNGDYTAGSVTDPFVTGDPNRIARGGWWAFPSSFSRSASRSSAEWAESDQFLGFRVVLAPVRSW